MYSFVYHATKTSPNYFISSQVIFLIGAIPLQTTCKFHNSGGIRTICNNSYLNLRTWRPFYPLVSPKLAVSAGGLTSSFSNETLINCLVGLMIAEGISVSGSSYQSFLSSSHGAWIYTWLMVYTWFHVTGWPSITWV